ncbi:unnamed protein product [Alopecurus aequalis]
MADQSGTAPAATAATAPATSSASTPAVSSSTITVAPLDLQALPQVQPVPAPTGISNAFQMNGVQIANVIRKPLELSTGSYTQWRNMMELLVDSYNALDHILVDTAPAPHDLEWRQVDVILKRWIYGSISQELGGMILDTSRTARQLYVALEDIFLNNKRTRAVHLTGDLHEQRQGNLSVAQYCARIKTIADALREVDQPASDDTLVTVLTRGLTERHHVTAKILNSSIGRVSFDEARNMLLLDEMQARASERLASQSALIALGRNSGGGGPGGSGGPGGGVGPGGSGTPPPPGYPRPPSIHGGIGTYGPNYGASSPSPNQRKTKRKRFTNHGGYNPHGAISPQPSQQRPWTGYVHAWPSQHQAPHPPMSILGTGPSPQAFSAFAPVQYGGHQYGAPPSVYTSPMYNAPPPMPPPHLAYPPGGPTFVANTHQGYDAHQPGPSNSFEQSALIGALSDLSLHGNSGPWIADSGASTHLSANQGSSHAGSSSSMQQ